MFIPGTTAVASIGLYLPLLAWCVKHALLSGRELGYLNQPVFKALLVFSAMLMVSVLISPDVIRSLSTLRKDYGDLLILSVVSADACRDTSRRQRLFLALAYSGLLLAAADIGQYLLEFRRLGALSPDIMLHREFANGIVFLLPFTLVWAESSNRKTAWIGWGVYGVQLILLAGTGARGAWVAALIGMCVWALLRGTKRKLALAAGLGVIVCLIALAVFPQNLTIGKWMQGFDTSHRTTGTWGPALEMIQERPLLGYGLGKWVFHDEFNLHAPSRPNWSIPESLGPHSNYFEIAFAAGLLGLASLLAFYGMLVRDLVRCVGNNGSRDRDHAFFVAVLCSFVSFYLVRGMVESVRWNSLGILVGLFMATAITASSSKARFLSGQET